MANYQSLKAAINAVIKANGNKEITGTVLNEVLLAMVNSLGAGYQFAGVATPSTNPGTPDQKVFYLAGEGGTYTNFNNIAIPNGISFLIWNGSWSSQTVLSGDGGVFDISAYKATGGTLATYADLSAALGADGANIPVAFRRGGMSVKFVQSSDNKYVQYRLMSDTFNTDVTQWQGVDDEPTAGSDNLVKSGGVYQEVNQLDQKLIKLKGFGTSYSLIPNAGDTMYKTDTKTLVTRMADSSLSIIPFYDGAIYTYENELYIWDGMDLIVTTDKINKSLSQVCFGINTICAEQDYAENIVASVAGSDYANYIELSIPKGEVFLVYADFSSIISSKTIVLKLNTKTDSGDIVARLNNKEWTLIKPSVDVNIVGIFGYRSFVTSSANGIFRIKKLQSITDDGKLPLYDGILSNDGNVVANPSRKNTRVILNDAPLYLSIDEGYQVGYIYGDEPDNLQFGGYISPLTHGGTAVLNVSAKYIGFNIVKNASFLENEDPHFIVTNVNSNAAKNSIDSKTVRLKNTESVVCGNPLYPFVQGEIAQSTGFNNGAATVISSQIITYKGTAKISIPTEFKYIVFSREFGADSFVTSGWKNGDYSFTSNGQFYLIVAKQAGGNITPDELKNCYLSQDTAPNIIENYPQYNFSVIGQDYLYYDEPNIILRKNRRYKITFNGVLATNIQSGEILNIAAFNVDNPEEYVSIAYRTASDTSVPATKYIMPSYDCFIRQYNYLTKDSYLNIKVKEEPTSIERAVKQMTPDADKINLLISNLNSNQFFEGDLITEPSTLMAVCGGLDIVDKGDFYVGFAFVENAASEYSDPHINIGLIVGNIIDPSNTKEIYNVALYGDTIIDGITLDYTSGEPIAKKINENEIAVFETGYCNSGVGISATRIFNIGNKTFGDFQKCYLNVTSGGSNNRFQMRINEADMRQIHQLTGMHNWDDVSEIPHTYGYYMACNPIKVGEWFYMGMDIGMYAPALVRTQDFIDFYFVCELPFGKTIDETFVYNPTEEVALAYMNNRLYASCRGNKGRFPGVTEGVDYYGYNQIMSADFDDVLAGTAQWDIVDLETYWYERPSMVVWNNQLYLYTGAMGTWSYKGIEGKNLNRFKHMFFIFDRNLNIVKKELMNPDNGYLHPTLQKFGNSVYSVNQTDVRNFMYNSIGDNRSELRLKRLDMQLLEM